MIRSRLAPFALLVVGCPAPTEPAPDPIPLDVPAHTEGTSLVHPMLPWPSDRWLVDDSTTATGKRLAYDPIALPSNREGSDFDVVPYARLDGFPPSAQPLTAFSDDVDISVLPGEGEYGDSLLPDSKLVMIEVATGTRVPVFLEPDMRAREDDPNGKILLYVHPAARLKEATEYGVALRGLQKVSGGDAEVNAAFAALRDAVVTDNALIEGQRPRYERLFAALAGADVPRAELTQAWSFTTASGDAIGRDILAMRDDAMARVGVGAGECEVEDVDVFTVDEDSRIRYRISANMKVPRYMDGEYSPAQAVRDPATDLPVFQDWQWVPFTVMVPHSAYDAPGKLVMYGHGLMGDQGEVRGSFVKGMAQDNGWVFVAADLHGMSAFDIVTVGNSLANISDFYHVSERLMQGVINWLVLARAMTGACRELPGLADYAVPTTLPIADGPPYYIGISQGAIEGTVVSALSQDIERTALLVGGINYAVMIPRSSNFPTYEQIFRPWYDRRIDREILLNVIMSLWDKSEPNYFAAHLVSDPLPDTPTKQVLYQVAVNDTQVPNLSSAMAIRTMGLPLLHDAPLDLWGVDRAEDGASSASSWFDFGRPLGVEGNVPPPVDNDVHGDERFLGAAQAQIVEFFNDGTISSHCDGACDPE
jgi:hypothetical protein